MNKIKEILAGIKKDPKQMIIAVSAAVALVLLIDLNFVMKPQAISLFDVMGKLGKIGSDLNGARSDIAKIESMKKSVDMYNEKIGKYEKTLPAESGIPDLLESLSEMAKSANMRIASIVPLAFVEPSAPAVPVSKKTAKTESRAYKEIPVSITAKAGYHEFGRFLASLENCDRFIKVSDMKIIGNEETPTKHDVEMKVVTYVLLEGK